MIQLHCLQTVSIIYRTFPEQGCPPPTLIATNHWCGTTPKTVMFATKQLTRVVAAPAAVWRLSGKATCLRSSWPQSPPSLYQGRCCVHSIESHHPLNVSSWLIYGCYPAPLPKDRPCVQRPKQVPTYPGCGCASWLRTPLWKVDMLGKPFAASSSSPAPRPLLQSTVLPSNWLTISPSKAKYAAEMYRNAVTSRKYTCGRDNAVHTHRRAE